jgi:hypothetical protein
MKRRKMMEKAAFKMLWPDKCWHEPDLPSGILPLRARLANMSFQATFETKCKHCKLTWDNAPRIGGTPRTMEETFSNPNLLTWEGFGLLWERAQEMEWWGSFKEWLIERGYQEYVDYCHDVGHDPDCIEPSWDWKKDEATKEIINLINPQRFLEALYNFGVETNRIKEG